MSLIVFNNFVFWNQLFFNQTIIKIEMDMKTTELDSRKKM